MTHCGVWRRRLYDLLIRLSLWILSPLGSGGLSKSPIQLNQSSKDSTKNQWTTLSIALENRAELSATWKCNRNSASEVSIKIQWNFIFLNNFYCCSFYDFPFLFTILSLFLLSWTLIDLPLITSDFFFYSLRFLCRLMLASMFKIIFFVESTFLIRFHNPPDFQACFNVNFTEQHSLFWYDKSFPMIPSLLFQ